MQLLSKYNQKLIRKTKWYNTEVKLTNTSDIDDKIIYLSTNFNFMSYNLFNCSYVTDGSVCKLSNIHSLSLAFCENITDTSIKILGEASINAHSDKNRKTMGYKCSLYFLNLEYCEKLTDDSIKLLGHLHVLCLPVCNFTDTTIMEFGRVSLKEHDEANKHDGYHDNTLPNKKGYSHSLHSLSVWYNKNITDDHLYMLNKISFLNIGLCDKINTVNNTRIDYLRKSGVTVQY